MGGRLALWYHVYGSLWTAKNIQTNNLISENILSFHQFNRPPVSSWTVNCFDVYGRHVSTLPVFKKILCAPRCSEMFNALVQSFVKMVLNNCKKSKGKMSIRFMLPSKPNGNHVPGYKLLPFLLIFLRFFELWHPQGMQWVLVVLHLAIFLYLYGE